MLSPLLWEPHLQRRQRRQRDEFAADAAASSRRCAGTSGPGVDSDNSGSADTAQRNTEESVASRARKQCQHAAKAMNIVRAAREEDLTGLIALRPHTPAAREVTAPAAARARPRRRAKERAQKI